MKIISGGQTGADRAALDAASLLGISTGGWIPLKRRAEDGIIPPQYNGMQETTEACYESRTCLNVRDSDGTAIFTHADLQGGTLLTANHARLLAKPLLILNFSELSIEQAASQLVGWLKAHQIKILNCAGPRASTDPDIANVTTACLLTALRNLAPNY